MKNRVLSELGRLTKPPPISWLMAAAIAKPGLISLAAGFTDHETLPIDECLVALRRILGQKRSGQAALQYGTTAGHLKLRKLTADRLHSLDGTQNNPGVTPERIVLTNGSQQLLYMVTEALCDPGDIVLVEDPTYFVYLGILQSHGVNARGIRLQKDGLDVEQLKRVLQELKRKNQLARLKLLYIVSYYQNPSGTTTSFDKKREILNVLRSFERAAGHPIYLIEDAAYRELRFDGPGERSSLALENAAARVIYAGTYSKPFATGIRVGFAILPHPLLNTVLNIKGNHDFGSSNFLQHLLADTMESGAYEQHLAVLKERYRKKARVMLDAMKSHFPAWVQWQVPRGGLYFWATVSAKVATGMKSKLFREALKKNVLYVPGELCYCHDPARRVPNHEMRISFGAENPAKLREGIKRLGAALNWLRP